MRAWSPITYARGVAGGGTKRHIPDRRKMNKRTLSQRLPSWSLEPDRPVDVETSSSDLPNVNGPRSPQGSMSLDPHRNPGAWSAVCGGGHARPTWLHRSQGGATP